MRQLHFLSIDSTVVSKDKAQEIWHELTDLIKRYHGELYITSVSDGQMKLGFFISDNYIDNILGYTSAFSCVRVYI